LAKEVLRCFQQVVNSSKKQADRIRRGQHPNRPDLPKRVARFKEERSEATIYRGIGSKPKSDSEQGGA
jgi:hypothetical protein